MEFIHLNRIDVKPLLMTLKRFQSPLPLHLETKKYTYAFTHFSIVCRIPVYR